MDLHAAEIAKPVAPGIPTIPVSDSAGWQTDEKLIAPDKISLLDSPLYFSTFSVSEKAYTFFI